MSLAEYVRNTSGYRRVSLGDILTLINGRAYKQEELLASGTPVIRIQNLNGGDRWYYSDLKLPEDKYCNEGDLLFAWSATFGPYFWNGPKAIFHYHIWKIVPSGDLDKRYAFYLLQNITSLVKSAGRGISMIHMTKSGMEAWEVDLPPLGEQKRIAAILDKADQLRQKRRQAIALLDSLTQSIFFDIFGDPASNPKGWRQVRLSECCGLADDIKCGPFGTQLYQRDFRQSGVPLWGIKHVNKTFRLFTHEYVSEVKARELGAYNLLPGDLVMTRKGTIGNCALYPADFEPGIMHSDLLRVRLDGKLAVPRFMNAQLHLSNSVAHQLSLISGGAVMAGINVGKLKKISVLLPPLELQKEFDTALRGAELSALNCEMSAIHLDSLFASLQHRAFTGQL